MASRCACAAAAARVEGEGGGAHAPGLGRGPFANPTAEPPCSSPPNQWNQTPVVQPTAEFLVKTLTGTFQTVETPLKFEVLADRFGVKKFTYKCKGRPMEIVNQAGCNKVCEQYQGWSSSDSAGDGPKTAIFRHFRLETGLSVAAAGDSAGPTAVGGGLGAFSDGGERLAGCAGQVRSRQRRCQAGFEGLSAFALSIQVFS